MKPLRFNIPLRAVFYTESGKWIAHCLEFDLVGHGETRRAALDMLRGAIAVQVEFSIQHGSMDNLFTPAEGKFFRMFAAGKKTALAKGKLKIHLEPVTIEQVETREYSEPGAELAPA